MTPGQEGLFNLVAAATCFLTTALIVHWARPADGKLSPRLQSRGRETLAAAVASMMAVADVGFTFGAGLALFK